VNTYALNLRSPPADEDRVALAWQALAEVEDPEIPGLKILDLGLIRFVRVHAGVLEVGLSPTYVGCPATEVIHHDVVQALRDAQIGACIVTSVLSPAWSSDWITTEGRQKLLQLGIVPPERTVLNMREVLRADRPWRSHR